MTLCLNEVWNELTKDLNDNRNEWWRKITDRLAESNRKYHNLDHLENKYKLYLHVKHLISNKDAMEYGLFFSYFEYEPKFIDSDERNIEHFKTFCKDCGLSLESELCRDVISLLGCIGSHITEEHKTEGAFGQEDKHYFLDLDMVVLGSDPEDYAEYTMKVREEYDFLPPDVYKALRVKFFPGLFDHHILLLLITDGVNFLDQFMYKGNSSTLTVLNLPITEVLQTFLQIPNIFATKEFREKFEEKAQINIQNEIKLLL